MPKCPQTPTRKPKKRLTKSQAKLKAANQRYLQFKQFDEFYIQSLPPQLRNRVFPKHDIWYSKGYKTLKQVIRTNKKLKERQKRAETLIQVWEHTLSKEIDCVEVAMNLVK